MKNLKLDFRPGAAEAEEAKRKKQRGELDSIMYQLLKNREEMNKQLQRRLFTGAKLIRKGGDKK